MVLPDHPASRILGGLRLTVDAQAPLHCRVFGEGGLIRDGLQKFVPELEYREWAACGRYPWMERAVQEDFYRVLIEWLSRSR
jgi:hypothetical protein